MIYILLGFYLFITGYVFFQFKKYNYNIDKTIDAIKKSLMSCCIKNKEKLKEDIGEVALKEVENGLKELQSCDEPIGFPFDICFDDKLSPEDSKIRKIILETLNKKNNYIIDGGVKKLVLPLEATIFLTKRLNPLVTEDGDIKIIAEVSQDSMNLNQLIIALEGEGIIYKDKKELIENLKSLEKMKNTEPKKQKDVKETEHEKQKDVEETEPKKQEEVKETEPEKQEEVKKDEPEKQEEVKKDEPEKQDQEETVLIINDDFSEDIFGGDLNSLLNAELDELDEDEEKIFDTHNKASFYKKDLTYKSLKNLPTFNKENFKDYISEIFAKEYNVNIFFKNLGKTKPIIFSDNKTVCFVPQENVYYAISRLYGLEFKEVKELFKTLKIPEKTKLDKAISHALERFLSDLMIKEKKSSLSVIKKGEEKYISFGFYFISDSFKNGLSEKEFNFWRSFPYNSEYTLSNEENKKYPRLVNNIDEVGF